MQRYGDYGGSGGEDDDGYGWDGIAIIWCAGGWDELIGSEHDGLVEWRCGERR